MEKTKISEVRGYTIFYDSRLMRFTLKDPNGDEVGESDKQAALEEKAKSLSKEKFSPIVAWRQSYHGFVRGKITSFNKDDNSYWFVGEDGRRSKEGGRYSVDFGLIADTPDNLLLIETIRERKKQISKLNEEIQSFEKDLTRITLKDLTG